MFFVSAVLVVAKSRDLANVISIGYRGGRMMARIYDNGELCGYALGKDGMVALPRNWPRLIHEGNWSAMIGGALNIITATVLLGLLLTGSLLWARRKFRRPVRSAKKAFERPGLINLRA